MFSEELKSTKPPRILVIDDLFGRVVDNSSNPDRENLCAHFLLNDISDDESTKQSSQLIVRPIADAVFVRGQNPRSSTVGDFVENDLPSVLKVVRDGWNTPLNETQLPWAMVFLDLCFYTGMVTKKSDDSTRGMPEGRVGDDDSNSYFGLTLLDAIHHEFPDLPVMILSSKPREEVSLRFSEMGALGFIARDDLNGAETVKESLWSHGLLPDYFGEIAGNSIPILLALREARRATRHKGNILIRGERGTGKELFAHYLNRRSLPEIPQGDRHFVTVNSAVFTPSLFASELFGIESRTATGVDGKLGLIEAADGGDLFLDEIADMPAEVQAAILRVLQDRQITPVGARKPRSVDVRFLAATNIDLEADSSGFRPDLLDRLRVGGTLHLPALRERKNDIPILVERFLREAESQREGALRRGITGEALSILLGYDWPGNVRELKSIIFDAVNRNPGVEHLVPGHLRLVEIPSSRKHQDVNNSQSERESSFNSNTNDDLSPNRFIVFQRKISFDPLNIEVWAGQMDLIVREHALLMSRYLEAALNVTRRRSAADPAGRILIHPAVKLITGDDSISASRAADIVKRILNPLVGELQGDLKVAYETALRLRPRSTSKLKRSSRRRSP